MRRLLYIIIIATALGVAWGCSDKPDISRYRSNSITTCDELQAVLDILNVDSVTAYMPSTDSVPGSCIPLEVRFHGNYAKVFNDSNYVHWVEAERIGIDPITDTRSFWITKQPLEKITPCVDFYVEDMKYSSPYLVPKAARMVHEVGRRFNRVLAERGGGAYRIKVTSALRTPVSIKRLHSVNPNSVDSSTHLLGTTVDISYARFICDDPSTPRSMEDLKGILAEVLEQMRDEGWCYVKYERKQPCFHITCRDYNFSK